MSTETGSSAAAAGLRGVVAAQSAIGDVNGEQGILIYQGYNIHDLAEHSTFEEVIFLLWNGRLPKAEELADLERQFRANYVVPDQVLEMMKTFPTVADPMPRTGAPLAKAPSAPPVPTPMPISAAPEMMV